MRIGDVFTIEPIVIESKDYDLDLLEDDGWTLLTRDGSYVLRFLSLFF